jgi:hypothetical protein
MFAVIRTAGLGAAMLLGGCKDRASSDGSADAPSPTAQVTPEAPAGVPSPVTRSTVHHPRALDDVALEHLEHLELALSPVDQVGRLAESDSETACTELDLAQIAAKTPHLKSLRISGCQAQVEAGLGSFGARLQQLELVDLELSRPLLAGLSALTGLQALDLSRVKAPGASWAPLHALSLHTLRLSDLERDSDVADLLAVWPRSLERVELTGSWAGHDAMLRLAKAGALRELVLADTRVGTFSLNQLKPLSHLQDLTLRGRTFTDSAPLYFRDLPVKRLRCTCSRWTDGALRSLRHSRAIEHLELHQTQITGAGLAALRDLTGLRTLSIGDRDVGAEGYAVLAELPSLRHLELSGELEDPKMRNLGLLTRIETLRLDYPMLDGRVASELAKLVGLLELDLGGTRFSDEGLSALSHMTALRRLELHHTRVTNRGFAHLSGLVQLEILELDHTDVVDAAVAHLAGLSRLRELRLDSTLVTDAVVQHLRGLQQLEAVNLSDTVITPEAAAELQSLPNLRVLAVGDSP